MEIWRWGHHSRPVSAHSVWRNNSVAAATDESCPPATLVGYERCVGSSIAHDMVVVAWMVA